MNKDYILRMKPKVMSPARSGSGRGGEAVSGWEVRPGGMLVQKRNSDSNQNSNSAQNIKVKVKYGSLYHEVVIGSQASFGELKKMLAGRTGLHTQDQKLIFKEKERDSKAFLDTCGVRTGSKIVLIEDELSRERRCLESRKNATMEKASKEVEAIRFEVDKIAKQVASIEFEINGGKKVVETVLLNLIELLMTQLIKLDAVVADGDVKLQRRMQVKNKKYKRNLYRTTAFYSVARNPLRRGVLNWAERDFVRPNENLREFYTISLTQDRFAQVKRVQKYIEVLDMLKIRNSVATKLPLQQQQNQILMPKTCQKQQEQMRKHGIYSERVNPGPVVVTTKWETF